MCCGASVVFFAAEHKQLQTADNDTYVGTAVVVCNIEREFQIYTFTPSFRIAVYNLLMNSQGELLHIKQTLRKQVL